MSKSPQTTPIKVDDFLLANWPLPMPSEDGDKDERGRILLVGGSPQMPGAIMLAANAALRAGAGKLTVATARTVAPLVAAQIPEAKVIALAEDDDGLLAPHALQDSLAEIAGKIDAFVIGPGMEARPQIMGELAALLPLFVEARIVLDAGAMDAVKSASAKEGAAGMRPAVLITPHAGEMAHLTGLFKEAVLEDPDRLVQRMTREWQAVIALKGARTVIANPDGDSWEHCGGNSGLAVSGSGDTLAGIIGGLAARGASLEQAAVWGVALHAKAGEMLARRLGPLGFLAREIPGEIPGLMHRHAI